MSESRGDDTTVDVELDPRPDDEAQIHRRLAAELFNHVWSLLEKPDRDQADDGFRSHLLTHHGHAN